MTKQEYGKIRHTYDGNPIGLAKYLLNISSFDYDDYTRYAEEQREIASQKIIKQYKKMYKKSVILGVQECTKATSFEKS